jgi:hypothetical protein
MDVLLERIPSRLTDHRVDLTVTPVEDNSPVPWGTHFASGLPSVLVDRFGDGLIGDPFAGSGRLAWETERPMWLNDNNRRNRKHLDPTVEFGCVVSYDNAASLSWCVDTLISQPPLQPDVYTWSTAEHAVITSYRDSMAATYRSVSRCAPRMVLVVRNWWRLGHEVRFDLETIALAELSHWRCVDRHGWQLPATRPLSRRAGNRNTSPLVEDVLVFEQT